MTDKEYADKCHDYAERMATLLRDIVDGGDPDDWRVMMREAEELEREWDHFSTVAYKQMRVAQ